MWSGALSRLQGQPLSLSSPVRAAKRQGCASGGAAEGEEAAVGCGEVAHAGEGGEGGLDTGEDAAALAEAGGDGVGGDGGGGSEEGGHDGGGLFDAGGGEGGLGAGGGDFGGGGAGAADEIEAVGGFGEAGNLVVRSEPADRAPGFLGGALVVEDDEAGEDFRVGQIDGPAICGGNGGIEAVVEFLEDEDKAVVVDQAVGWREIIGRNPGTELLKNIVYTGEGQMGMFGEDALAVGIKTLSNDADALTLYVVRNREWEGIEYLCFVPSRVISDP